MKKLIGGALDKLTGGEVDPKRRAILKGTAAAGALAALPKGAKKLMGTVAKQLPKNIQNAKPFKVLERDALRGTFKFLMNPRYRHGSEEFRNVYWEDGEIDFEIFSAEDIRRIYQNAMKNKMKATGQSSDEVLDDFLYNADELKDIEYQMRNKENEWVENKPYYRKLLSGTEEDYEELLDSALHKSAHWRQNHRLLMNDEVIKWADGDEWTDAFEKVHKAKEIDPDYMSNAWVPDPKTDLFGDTEDGTGLIDTPRIEEWLEGERSFTDMGEWQDHNLNNRVDLYKFVANMMEDYGLNKQQLAEYLRENNVIYTHLAEDAPMPKIVELAEDAEAIKKELDLANISTAKPQGSKDANVDQQMFDYIFED
tara:strand:+ start:8159 stop:9259 length:1101 start_codon:yes stop_codon:yes gene_type:complete